MARKRGGTARPDTWMPIYVGDYVRDTGRFTAEMHGAYLMLIFDYWTSGKPLPDDDELLATTARVSADRWPRIRAILEPFFIVGDGVWRHKRVEQELEIARENVDSRSNAGKIAAEKRWEAERLARARKEQYGGGEDANRMRDASKSHASRNADAMRQGCVSDAPSPSPIDSVSSIESVSAREGEGRDDPRAQRVVQAFLALRSKLWPNESSLPAPTVTLTTQAKDMLAWGAEPELIIEIVERVMRKNLERDQRAPQSLWFCNRSVEDAAKQRRGAGDRQDGDRRASRAPEDEGEAYMRALDARDDQWRSRIKLYLKNGMWVVTWGPRPGEPGSDVPKAIQAEFPDLFLNAGGAPAKKAAEG